MAQLFKRRGSPYWYARGYDGEGRLWRQCTKQTDRSLAHAVAKDTERRRLLEGGAAVTLESALELVRAKKVRGNASEATMGIMACKGGHLLRVFGFGYDLRRVTLHTCERYMELRRSEGVGNHTVAKELSLLKSALILARRHGHAVPGPGDIWPAELTGAYVPGKRVLSFEEYRFMLETTERPDHLTLYCRAGLRWSELYAIEARHRSNGMVFIDGTKTAAAKRWMPEDPEVSQVLDRRARLYPVGPLFPDKWQPQHVRLSLTRAARRYGAHVAGVRLPMGGKRVTTPFPWGGPVSCNDLRRTFCSWLHNAGVAESVTMKLMGHTSSAMVRRVYAQLSDTTLADAVSKLPSGRYVGGTTDTAATRDDAETRKHRAKLLFRG